MTINVIWTASNNIKLIEELPPTFDWKWFMCNVMMRQIIKEKNLIEFYADTFQVMDMLH